MSGEEKRVCVTGGGGCIASWLLKLLLSKGYAVHATIRGDPGDVVKYGHLKQMIAEEEGKLEVLKADLLDYDSLVAAISGCTAVFHVASPVPYGPVPPNPCSGTLNVLRVCSSPESNVKRVVIVSSVAAVCENPKWPLHKPKDETSWSDEDHCTQTNSWYCRLSKTLAEKEALRYARETSLDVISLCPSLVFGPILQQTPNASTSVLLRLLKAEGQTVDNKTRIVVDVRDVAEALVLIYERPEAEGRYICNAHTVSVGEIVEMLKTMYPNYNYPKSFSTTREGENDRVSSQRLQGLGWSYRPLEETLRDSVESYTRAGLLD
ncbi:unnamed protein product [Cuscuta campestris]|uniref:Dihydroflavonol 4-reductase n=1 Tax=Cuscuta campestris TaxID=132261 RepID=A0A484NQR2_9ASTE|nr:unnamed protein product [Cuscuta campestris]